MGKSNAIDTNYFTTLLIWEMLTDGLRTMVNNPFKKSFYEKRKKKVINVLTVFFIFHKSCQNFPKMNY